MKRFIPCCFVLASLAAGCSVASGDDTVHAKAEILGQTGGALSAGSITSLNGTYGALCDGHTSGDPWSIGANGNSTLTNAAIVVRKNDSDCVLTFTSLEVGGTTYAASAGIALSASWAGSPSSFNDSGATPIDFYGNAMMSNPDFSSDFVISLKVTADDNDSQTASKSGTFATWSGSVSAAAVPAPDYTVGMSSFSFTTDAANIVQDVSGFAQLALEAQSGQDYAVYDGSLSSSNTLAEVASAYSGATYSGLLSSLTSLQVPAAQFSLVGQDLTSAVVRTIIIRNTDQGVTSYELIRVTFNHP